MIVKRGKQCWFLYLVALLLAAALTSYAQKDTSAILRLLDTAFRYERSDYDKSKAAAEQSLKMSQETGFDKGVSQSYRQLGLLCYNKSEYEKAVGLFLKSLGIAEKNNYQDEKARVYLHLGLVYLDKAEYDKALQYFSDGKRICEKHGFKKGIPYYTTNIAIVYDLQQKFTEAIDSYSEVLAIMKQDKNLLGEANVENNIGNVYKHQGKFAEAKAHYLKALSLLRGMNDIYTAVTYGNAAEVIAEMKQYNQSLLYLDSAIVAAKEMNSPKIVRNCFEKKAKVYESMGDFKNAFVNGRRAREMQDTIFSEESQRNITEMQTRYETEKKEAENKLLKQDNELKELRLTDSKKRMIYLFAGMLLALLLLALAFYAYRIKIRTNKILEEQNGRINIQNETLKKLNMQLIAHEEELQLSNTAKDKLLSVISHDISNPVKALSNYSQAIIGESAKMDKADLTKAFGNVNNAVVPLQNMVENLLNWSYVQKNGFSINKQDTDLEKLVKECLFIYQHAAKDKKIIFENAIDKVTMVEADVDMMLLIIRNLLSNALKFTSEGGCIRISYDGSRKLFSVSNSGSEMSGEMINAAMKGKSTNSSRGTSGEKGTGMGLQLIRDCVLAQGFSWEIKSDNTQGTTVSIFM
jgi:signal transduction histidine kinase